MRTQVLDFTAVSDVCRRNRGFLDISYYTPDNLRVRDIIYG